MTMASLLLLAAASAARTARGQPDSFDCGATLHEVSTRGARLNVHVFMMSRCPFAARALLELIPTVAAHPPGSALLTLDFIGTGSGESSFASLHGPAEVAGDKLYLCLQDKLQDQMQFLGTAHCLVQNPSAIPSTGPFCMARSGVGAAVQREVLVCADGEEGTALLAKSFNKAGERRIGESPTIYYSGTGLDEGAVRGLSPGQEILYCGPRNQAGFVRASCNLIQAFEQGTELAESMLPGEKECPTSGPEAEPECVDQSVERGGVLSTRYMFGVVVCLAAMVAIVGGARARLCGGAYCHASAHLPPTHTRTHRSIGGRARGRRGMAEVARSVFVWLAVQAGVRSASVPAAAAAAAVARPDDPVVVAREACPSLSSAAWSASWSPTVKTRPARSASSRSRTVRATMRSRTALGSGWGVGRRAQGRGPSATCAHY
jgi:hypothetical protein